MITKCNEQKSLYQQLIGGLYDALVVTDPNGHIIQLNPRVGEFFQYTEAELVDKTISLLIPEVNTRLMARLQEEPMGTRQRMLETPCIRKDGSRFWGEISLSTLRLSSQKDLLCVVRNVETCHKQVEQLRSHWNAFNCALSALFICDSLRHYRFVNAAFLKMFGLGNDAHVIGQPFEKYLPDMPLPLLFERALAGECVACRILADAESDGDVEVDVQMMPDQQKDQIMGVVGSIVRVV